MQRNLAYSLVVFLICFCWVVCGSTVQIVMGAMPSSDAFYPVFLGIALGIITAIVFNYFFELAREKFYLKIDIESAYKPSRIFIGVAVFLIVSASVYSGVQSYSVGKLKMEKTALEQKAAQEKIEKEKQRLAAMTPDQIAEEEKQKKDRRLAAEKAAKEAEAIRVAEEKKELAEKAEHTLHVNLAGAAAKLLKQSMKDPDSFELKSLLVMPNGTACYEYRATNSFNAHLTGAAVLTTKGRLLTQEADRNVFIAVWNRECTVAGGEEIADAVRELFL